VAGPGQGGAGTLVLTVTPNPSIDLLFDAGRLEWDDANRLADPRRRPGGQGINVTRAVRVLGGTSEAVALLGGGTGRELAGILAAEGTPLHTVDADGETRTFVAVREWDTGRSLLLNARGPSRTPADARTLADVVRDRLASVRPAWLACCGSLPSGFAPDFYAELVGLARSAGCRVVVDCDGDALRVAAEAGCDLLVPNQHEAERLTGRRVSGVEGALAAARLLCSRGTPLVAVTLGADGAVLADSGGSQVRARPPVIVGGSAVGAGDAFLAGLLLALASGEDLQTVLIRGVAAAAATLRSRGTDLLAAADAHQLTAEVSPARTRD
jgi:1-phosphofructokinase family hexose kinase